MTAGSGNSIEISKRFPYLDPLNCVFRRAVFDAIISIHAFKMNQSMTS